MSGRPTRLMSGRSPLCQSRNVDSLFVGQNVNTDDLVGAAEVQAILGLSHPSSVSTYLRRYPDFPRPVVDLAASRVRLWVRHDVEHWREGRVTR